MLHLTLVLRSGDGFSERPCERIGSHYEEFDFHPGLQDRPHQHCVRKEGGEMALSGGAMDFCKTLTS